jgi:hypothetical protein
LTELPIIHDYYAVSSEVGAGSLRLALEWLVYNGEVKRLVVAERRWLCFSGLRDISERPRASSGAAQQPFGVLVRKLLGVGHNPSTMKTAQELIAQIEHRSTAAGEPLDELDEGFGGIIVRTHIFGEVFIPSRRVEWCTAPAVDANPT